MNTQDGVPHAYLGVWQRALYAGGGGRDDYVEDRSTRVVWLQTTHWHADLRVPADRPDFAGVMSLDQCNREQLVWLASQTAFAGITRVEGRFCTWHRLIDLQPGLEKDVGEMAWRDDGALEERHPRGLYLERWVRQVATHSEECIELGSDGLPRWLQWGEHVMVIKPRPTLSENHDLLAEPGLLDDDALRLRAGMEVSYARRGYLGWQIMLSTHPWREGSSFSPEA